MSAMLILFLILGACSKSQLHEPKEVININTGTKVPSSDCKKVGSVSGYTLVKAGKSQSYLNAFKSLQKEAHRLGANFIKLDYVSPDSKFITGVAYHCKKEAR